MSNRLQPIEPGDDMPLDCADDDDESDTSSDPFEILAAREEALGVPLFFYHGDTH